MFRSSAQTMNMTKPNRKGSERLTLLVVIQDIPIFIESAVVKMGGKKIR